MVRMLLTFLLFIITNGSGNSECPSPGSNAPCPWGIVFMLDTSSATDRKTVLNTIDFMKTRVLAAGNMSYGMFIYAYGLNDSPMMTWGSQTYTQMCSQLDEIRDIFVAQPTQWKSNLTEFFLNIDTTWTVNMIFFTGNKNYEDIHNAAVYWNYNPGYVRLSVLALSRTTYFSEFNDAYVFNVDPTFPPSNLEDCVVEMGCNNFTQCNQNYYPTESTPASWTTPSLNWETTTENNPTISVPEQTGCTDCNFYQIWNDVVYVLDASESTGNVGLQQMWGAVQTISDSFNIQTKDYSGTSYTMRVGVIRYASQAEVVFPLGTINNEDIDNKNTIPFYAQDYETNLEAALQLAVAQFDQIAHRANSRKVIVVMSAGYRPGSYNTPDSVSQSFQKDNGIIVTYQYGRGDVSVDSELQSIASPGYFIYGPSSSLVELQTAQCDANCFCPQPYVPYSSNTQRNAPSGGCYTASELQGNYAVAKRFCSKFANGFPATDKSDSQNTFFMNLFYGPKNFFIGLTWDSLYRTWVWPDGEQYSGYAPWYIGYEPNGNSQQCVYVAQSTGYWINTDCRTSMYYTCEANPCDSNHYCNVSL